MAYDFDGNSTSTNTARRQYAMKQAVNNFISSVSEKYSSEADHRISVVTFGSSASTLQGWTNVNEDGKGTLQTAINGLPVIPSGATNVAAGMEQAENLMGRGYNYTGANTQRQKVVIVFTDGVPTTNTDFDTTVATSAIASAKNLKDAGATVYTIGIFRGANPGELYGKSGFNTNSDGTVGSQWIKDTWGLFPGTDFPEADRPAGNRFLNYLSSNCPEAVSVGLERSTKGLGILHYKITYKITANSPRTDSNYYLTANDSGSLNTIFQTISENIQSANIDLGSETVVKDTVSPYFDVPANTTDIKLYTASAKENGTFENPQNAPSDVKATISGNAVSVTGFDFNANFVSDTAKSDGSYGKKLIIEFKVTPKDDFLGGNDVPTNDWQNTGVYDKSGAEVEKFADATTTPTVNVPIDDVTVTAQDKNIYLKGEVNADQLKDGAKVSVGDVELDLSKATDAEKPYGLDPWQTEYVDITVTVKDKNGNSISDKLENLTKDTTYTVSVTVAPKTDGTDASGEAAEAKTGANNLAANINVFKPELTFKDSTAYYGENVPTNNDYSGNKVSEKWMHGNTVSTDADVTMFGDKPTLDITYAPDGSKLDNGKYTKQDVPVSATVKIGEENVNGYTAFLHQNCTGKICALPEGYHFWIHIQTCTLTITKQDGADGEPYVFDIRKDGEKYSEVTIEGNDTQTLYELPVGTYTIKEDTGWSWRFNPSYSESVILSKDNTSGTITCTNTKNNDKWLNGFSDVVKNISDGSHNN